MRRNSEITKDQRVTIDRVIQIIPRDFPFEFLEEMSKWMTIVKSPYGHSYYSEQPGWNYKAPDSYRISDHWNFRANGGVHCRTTTSCPDNTHWTIAKFKGDLQMYEVIESIDKKKNSLNGGFGFQMMLLERKIEMARESIIRNCTNPNEPLKRSELFFLNKYYKILELQNP